VFRPVKALPAFVVDVVAILVFAILGRSSHDEANTLLGVLSTAWPFLAGATIGHAVCRIAAPLGGDAAARRPGVVVWAGTLVGGTVLRLASGDTAAWTFVVVAGVVLALFLVGWRSLFRKVQRARTRTDAGV
jgi:hypothetical protein